MGCGSYGPSLLSAEDIKSINAVTIGMRIVRSGQIVFDSIYSVSDRNREFSSIPNAIISKYHGYGGVLPLSKRVIFDDEGFLAAGTLIMLGTGLVVSGEYHCRVGDVITVYSDEFGELSNIVRDSHDLGEQE
jgi:fumarylacetoacetate (FAA) hydrolase family protein